MHDLNRCSSGAWHRLADLGHATSIKVDAVECSVCGRKWARLYVIANGQTLYEPISAELVTILQFSLDPGARKKAPADWLDSVDR
jgi:hypothetical protein